MGHDEREAASDERLVLFLKEVRHGLGLARPDLLPNIPVEVAVHLGLDAKSSSEQLSQKFFALVSRELNRMGEDNSVAARYARVGLNLSGAQVKWLERAKTQAKQERVSQRTIVRRVDAAFTLLSARLAARRAPETEEAREKVALARLKRILDRRDELRVIRFDVTVRVFTEHAEVHEVIEVLSQAPAAQYYVVGKTLPYRTTKVETHVLEGAEMLEVEQPNVHWLLELLNLPEPLPLGYTHRFAVLHDTVNMAPMWTATSHHDVEGMTVRVWYADRVGRTTWLIEDFPPNLLQGDDIEPILREHAVEIEVDRLGNASHSFQNLKQGRSYGLAWTNPQ